MNESATDAACGSTAYASEVNIQRLNGELTEQTDQIAIEEPLEIVLQFSQDGETQTLSLSITMRTPGDDETLVLGFLYSEGIINSANDVQSISLSGPKTEPFGLQNKIIVELISGKSLDVKRFQRHFLTHSSCGVCGRTAVETLQLVRSPSIPSDTPLISSELVRSLPARLKADQVQFGCTGGVHAVGLFDENGKALIVREDIGRHNAMDKVIGQMLRSGMIDDSNKRNWVVCVSSRASFELVQKALMANLPFFCAVGAPSSLAVSLAEEYGMTLVGFLKGSGYNTYSGQCRIEHRG